MGTVTLAATQMACTWDKDANIANAESLVREAAGQGAQVILLQELFQTPYFPQEQDQEFFALAQPAARHPVLDHFSQIAAELEVVLPVSFFERANNAYFNSVCMIDADGSTLGVYRKSHIPQAPGYEEKFYFNPGDTGFRVWPTRYCSIGVGICWDQWFPEAARTMALKGADVLLYPTAIGSEVTGEETSSKDHWQITMRGHAAANVVPVVASNRIGLEQAKGSSIDFYGSSFIADYKGALATEAGREEQTVLTATFDLDAIRAHRAGWGLFRDRRPELYTTLATLDGVTA